MEPCKVLGRMIRRIAALTIAAIPKPASGRAYQEPGIALMTALPARIGIECARERGARRWVEREINAQAREASKVPANPVIKPR